MAVKKSAKASAAKAAPKKTAAPKKAAETKAAAPKKAATKAAAPKKAAAKAAAPKKAAESKAAAPKKAAAKTAAPVKLTDKQKDILKKVGDSKEQGYLPPKAESRVLESLQTKKLIKRGAKDKTSGAYRYLVTKTGQKHLDAPAPSPTA